MIPADVSQAVAPSTEAESLPNPRRDRSHRSCPRFRARGGFLALLRTEGNRVPTPAPIAVGDDTFLPSSHALSNPWPIEGNHVRLLENGDDLSRHARRDRAGEPPHQPRDSHLLVRTRRRPLSRCALGTRPERRGSPGPPGRDRIWSQARARGRRRDAVGGMRRPESPTSGSSTPSSRDTGAIPRSRSRARSSRSCSPHSRRIGRTCGARRSWATPSFPGSSGSAPLAPR